MPEIETIIWCPCCKTDFFEVERREIREGICQHWPRALTDHQDHKVCPKCRNEAGQRVPLERKP